MAEGGMPYSAPWACSLTGVALCVWAGEGRVSTKQRVAATRAGA